ncbi:MAG: NnrS family protein [Deltaproteobacteria bacterium]|nr:NnrS family protein [Deltaproteobacteria bacterium]
MKIPQIVLSEPYRIFFPLGFIMGLFGISYWVAVSTGLVQSYNPLYHGIIQIELFSAAFAVGFLLTALPKFLQARPTTMRELACLVAAYLVLGGAALLNNLVISQWSFVILISLLIRFAAIRVKERKAAPPFPFLLVAFGLLEGVLGALLLIYPWQLFPGLGQLLLEQGMFLSLSLGVGSFLGPRLMGVVDPANAAVTLPRRAADNLPLYKSPAAIVLAIGLTIFVSFFIEAALHREVGIYLRAAAAFLCLARFNVIRIPRSRTVIGILAAVSLWCMPLGILLAGMFPEHASGMLHLLYIGGFGLLILTIGAQVISTHGGVHRFWEIYKNGAILIGVTVAASVVVRMSATLFPQHYFLLLGTAAMLFDTALILWGAGVLRYISSTISRAPWPVGAGHVARS